MLKERKGNVQKERRRGGRGEEGGRVRLLVEQRAKQEGMRSDLRHGRKRSKTGELGCINSSIFTAAEAPIVQNIEPTVFSAAG